MIRMNNISKYDLLLGMILRIYLPHRINGNMQIKRLVVLIIGKGIKNATKNMDNAITPNS